MYGQVVAREGSAKTWTEALVEFRGGPSETGIPCPCSDRAPIADDDAGEGFLTARGLRQEVLGVRLWRQP